MDCINVQDIGDFVVKIFEEYFKFQRIQYVQNCVMYLIGVCQIFIGCGDYIMVGVFKLIQMCFKLFYGDVVQIYNIVVYRVFIGCNECFYNILVFKDNFGF